MDQTIVLHKSGLNIDEINLTLDIHLITNQYIVINKL